MDRSTKDKRYVDKMDLNGVNTGTMQAWNALYGKREKAHGIPDGPIGLPVDACWWTKHSAAPLEV